MTVVKDEDNEYLEKIYSLSELLLIIGVYTK